MFVQSCGFQRVFSFTDLHKPGCADEALERPKSIQSEEIIFIDSGVELHGD